MPVSVGVPTAFERHASAPVWPEPARIAHRMSIDEADRLRALRETGMMETTSDRRLDALVHKAAMLLNMPLAAVTLIDDSRQLVKASIGIGLGYSPRDLSFCRHTILGSEPFMVTDTQADTRFVDNPVVTGDPGIRFYLGVPVYGPRQQPLGALCVMDTRPQPGVADGTLEKLRLLADEVSAVFSEPTVITFKTQRDW